MTESKMTIDHATASTTDHNQVKNILEPFRQIFMTVLENAEIYCDGRHSVFAITTASREQYIADFTLEQFGYPAGLWFFEKAEYFARYVEVGAGSRIALEEEMDAAERDVTESDIQEHTRYCIDAICGEIHWPDYHKLSAEERIPWLDARAREIVGRLEAEDHLNSAPDAH